MSGLAVMVTRRCNMACAHCSVESGPRAGTKGPPLADLLAAVREAAAAGVSYINVTGGEPMLRERAVLEIVRECRRLGLSTRITSNGFWGRTAERARRTLAAMIEAGMGGLTVSYDRFHAAFQGPTPVVHIARAAAELGIRIEVNVTRLADDEEIEDLISPFAELPAVRLRFYDVQPVGAARQLPGAQLRSEVEGFCNACEVAALTDDGRVTACNGPSYFLPPGNPLAIGSLREAPLGELLARHREDPILETIRTEGPGGLRDALREIPGFEFPLRERYAGMCDLCHHITASPEAVAALRTALSAPARVAQRVARRQLIAVERKGRSLSREHANTRGSAPMFLALAAGETPDPEIAGRVLGRADLDWRARAEALIAAGLARPLAARLEEPTLARWAPALFGALLRRAAARDEEIGRVQREALEHLAATLRDRGASGTIVGGAALWHWTGDAAPGRSVPAIEVVVADRDVAAAASAALGDGSAVPPVAIRSRIAPPPWALADEEILRAARPVPDPRLGSLRRLAPSDGLIVTLVSASAAGLRIGLETAWDARAALRAEPADVERIARIVARMTGARAFWVPARVLAERAAVPIPPALLAAAPADARQRRLERVAGRRLFRDRPAVPVAEWSFRWAWPLLASRSAADFGRRLPSALVQAATELPAAWREIGSGGVAGAVRGARKAAVAWTSEER